MSLRLKVYSFVAVLAIVGGGAYIYKTKPAWFGAIAQAKATDAQKDKKRTRILLQSSWRSQSEARSPPSSPQQPTCALSGMWPSPLEAEGVVEKVLAEEGDFVKEGQVLCKLDDAHFRIKLKLTAKNSPRPPGNGKSPIRQQKALAQIDHAQAEFDRTESRKEGLVSDKDSPLTDTGWRR